MEEGREEGSVERERTLSLFHSGKQWLLSLCYELRLSHPLTLHWAQFLCPIISRTCHFILTFA